MKRVALAVLGTIGGLIGLLSFKSHAPEPIAAQLPAASDSSSATPAPTPSGSALAPAPSETAEGSTTRTVTGDAVRTRYGTVQVKVTMTGAHIDTVEFVQLTARDSRSQQINAAAAPILLKETLSAQSADIDAVSGATYTSDGYMHSLQSALDKSR